MSWPGALESLGGRHVIRDVASGRFVYRELHYIDFVGRVLRRQGPIDLAMSAAGRGIARTIGKTGVARELMPTILIRCGLWLTAIFLLGYRAFA